MDERLLISSSKQEFCSSLQVAHYQTHGSFAPKPWKVLCSTLMRHGLRAYIELEVLLVERPYQVSASGCMVLVRGQMALRQQSMRGQESGRMG